STRDGFLGRSRSGPFAVQAGSLTDSFSREPSVAGAFVGHLPVWQKTAPNCRHPEAILGGGNGPSPCGGLPGPRAIPLGAAVPPGLLVLLAGVVAGPEQPFAAGQPVAQRVAAVAAATRADHPLPRRPFQPPRQRRALRHAGLDRPAFEDLLLAELVGRRGQDVVHLGPGLHQDRTARVGTHQVVGAVGVQFEDEVARRLGVARVGTDTAPTVGAAGASNAAHLHDDVGETRQGAGAARRLAVG